MRAPRSTRPTAGRSRASRRRRARAAAAARGARRPRRCDVAASANSTPSFFVSVPAPRNSAAAGSSPGSPRAQPGRERGDAERDQHRERDVGEVRLQLVEDARRGDDREQRRGEQERPRRARAAAPTRRRRTRPRAPSSCRWTSVPSNAPMKRKSTASSAGSSSGYCSAGKLGVGEHRRDRVAESNSVRARVAQITQPSDSSSGLTAKSRAAGDAEHRRHAEQRDGRHVLVRAAAHGSTARRRAAAAARAPSETAAEQRQPDPAQRDVQQREVRDEDPAGRDARPRRRAAARVAAAAACARAAAAAAAPCPSRPAARFAATSARMRAGHGARIRETAIRET